MWEVEKEMRFVAVGGRMEEAGVIAVWMPAAADDDGARRAVDAEALGADGAGGVAGEAGV